MNPARAAAGALALLALLSALPAAAAGRAAPAAGRATPPDTGIFAPVALRYRADLAALAAMPQGAVTPARIELLVRLGRVDEAHTLLPRLAGDARAVGIAKARVLLLRQDFRAAAPRFARLAAIPRPRDEERELFLSWLFAHDDDARVDTLTRDALGSASGRIADLLAAGRLACSLMSYDRADSCYALALERIGRGEAPLARAECDTALIGLAQVKIGRRDWDGALATSLEAVQAGGGADAMIVLAMSLLRVGRVDEAITAAEWATLLNPYSEMAHYMRGNGYTVRKNYTQLEAACPRAFADGAGRRALGRGDSLLARGDRGGARVRYEAVRRAHPGWVDPLARLASLDFEEGRFDGARDLSFAALAICPEYGRAHAILAKALQFERFAVDVHRAAYEARFAAAPMPDLPGIERFVLNWASLPPRDQKRVALSIAPWKQFVPVLLAGGADFYIKPLWMRLSEVPGQETLKDQRIDYDSRLWDDVRGCGGYHTVTGIEDVEATIFDHYNTVLHELTHQVHAVLTADQSREIRELYQAAKARDEVTHDAFISRYSGVAVEEYLAEGANAYISVDRDAYDSRPEIRSRLERRDPALEARVVRRMAQSDVSASYPVAFVNAGDDRVSRGLVDEALGSYAQALARNPAQEEALISRARALALGNRRSEMLGAADSGAALLPASGVMLAAAAIADWHGGRGLDQARARLENGRPKVRAAERWQVDLERSRLAWAAGDTTIARVAADSVLAVQSDNPEGLWSRACALALAGRNDEAFAVYDQAVRMRTGIAGLRCDYARDLMRAGRDDRARAQLDEAALLDPENTTAEALRGWLALHAGDPAAARRHARQALAWNPECDLARIGLGAVERRSGNAAAADSAWAPVRARLAANEPPGYVYRAKLATWEAIHELPAVERAMLAEAERP
ncbi:MAG TPA: tetratricopeptide repeat protein [Terriglobales bacterium]|nr:tetratricopeptide repeat protein [Terriglobales bacterium]